MTLLCSQEAESLTYVHPKGLASGLLSYPFVLFYFIFWWFDCWLWHSRYTHPIQVGWCSRNSGAVASRTVNASLYNMFVQASSVISSQIYRADDAPRCKIYLFFPFYFAGVDICLLPDRRGNRILITICCVNLLVLYPGTKLYYLWRNKQRDKVWNAMTVEVRTCLSPSRIKASLSHCLGASALFTYHDGCRKSSSRLPICTLILTHILLDRVLLVDCKDMDTTLKMFQIRHHDLRL